MLTIPASFIVNLEKWLNQLIQLDPAARGAFGELSGKVIAVEFIEPAVVFYLLPQEEGIRLHTAFEGAVNVRISGRPLALLSMAMRRPGDQPTVSGDVEVSGDVRLAQRFQRILDEVDIDWEELLSRWVGDIAAHQLGKFGRSLREWAGETKRTLEMDISEYLREESDLVARQEDVAEFVDAVDTLRGDLDRLEESLKQIERDALEER
ncbi:MAG: SCP2 sterol-binding domain-containing protein [Gammaproteobacteria bacterium]